MTAKFFILLLLIITVNFYPVIYSLLAMKANYRMISVIKGLHQRKIFFRRIYFSAYSDNLNDINNLEAITQKLSVVGSCITPYWIEQLKKIQKSSALSVISQIVMTNPLGFESSTGPAKKGTLVEYILNYFFSYIFSTYLFLDLRYKKSMNIQGMLY